MKSYRSDVQRHLGAVVVEKVWSERVVKLLEYANDVAWARSTSNTTRLFAAVMLASPNKGTSTGFFFFFFLTCILCSDIRCGRTLAVAVWSVSWMLACCEHIKGV